tara:strand:- start:2290 stop:2958 length:669 start_codon:yes stop_codon:yes gene_type:complete
MLTLGIDDSGRGPVIGPMILAGVLIDKELEEELRELGVKDSKTLTSTKREILATIIKKKALSYHIVIISASEVDIHVKSVNINTLEALKAGQIINKINKGLDKIKVVVDCPSPNINKWTDVLKTYIDNKKNLEISCEHKADQNHISVSAASILAKSTREKEVKKIKKKLGIEFGSGYPSDPITKEFLAKNSKKHEKSGIFRKTWSTYKKANSKKEQKNLEDY